MSSSRRNTRVSAGSARPGLLFVSTRFLFPVDSGGKIRTTQILRGLKGGAFHVTLASPCPAGGRERYATEIEGVCDRFVDWPEADRGPLFRFTRLRHLAAPLPVAVATDRSAAGVRAVADAMAADCDLAVVDFPHADVLAPPSLPVPGVMFTHNVEAEIFRRHVDVADRPWTRAVWQDQHRKMAAFERAVLEKYDTIVAVSARDGAAFVEDYAIPADKVATINTGVDLDFFAYTPPRGTGRVVFTGSMDWMANIDGIEFFLERVWPRVLAQCPDATMRVIGRAPPPALVEKAARLYPQGWEFTGFVDDVRPAVAGADAFVIPLRVGGGTRLKAFEGMAMGSPIVSTSIGMEGLDVTDGTHYLCADDEASFADAVVELLQQQALRSRIAQAARSHVEAHCSYRSVARQFEAICLRTLAQQPAAPDA
jgi:glycosyltransferase involved in cell wall biosynthesis